MKFKIRKNILLKGLTLVQGVIEKKKTLPILANVLIEAENNIITLTATDLEIGIKSKYESEVIKSGKITVSAKKLFEIVKELSDEIIEIESKDNNWIELKCGNAKFNIVALPPEEYPFINDVEGSANLVIDSKLIKSLIDKTFYSISTDESKYNLNGLFIHNIDNKLRVISTDGHRLSLFQTEIDASIVDKLNTGVIIPRKGIIELKKITEDYSENLDINFIDNNIIVNNEETTLIMRLIDGDFPDYNRVIPENLENYAVVESNIFLQTLKRISILANEKSRGINLNLSQDKLEISSSNPEFGDATDFIDIEYNGPDISVGFNAKYLLDVMNTLNTGSIRFFINDNISPCLIKSLDNDEYQAVIMPMRL